MDNIITEPKYKRRTGRQIKFEIFEYINCNPRVRKTWVLNASHLNSKNFNRHFELYRKANLIEYSGDFVVLTSSGKIDLEAMRIPKDNK